MHNIKIFCDWDLKFDFFYEKQIELYVDKLPVNKSPNDVIRFLFLLEPPEIDQYYKIENKALFAIQNGHIDYLLTHNQELLDSIENSYLQEFGTTWIRNFKFPLKIFEVSTLIGGKKMVEGHYLRHKILQRQHQIAVPKKIWLSQNYPTTIKCEDGILLKDGKEEMFDSQFHI